MEHLTPRLVSWASILDEQTREQAARTARMPFVHPHVALMPDAHLGKGATVGSVIPTEGALIPAAVGVDIGCGMMAVRTPFTASDLPSDRARVREAIEAAVPVSAGGYNQDVSRQHTRDRLDDLATAAEKAGFDPRQYVGNWELQLGTLGSGNHFVELSLDEQDRVWLFLHSGSRGVGNSPSTTSRSRSSCAGSGGSSSRTPTWPTSCRAPTSSGPTSGSCGGRRSSRGRTGPR